MFPVYGTHKQPQRRNRSLIHDVDVLIIMYMYLCLNFFILSLRLLSPDPGGGTSLLAVIVDASCSQFNESQVNLVPISTGSIFHEPPRRSSKGLSDTSQGNLPGPSGAPLVSRSMNARQRIVNSPFFFPRNAEDPLQLRISMFSYPTSACNHRFMAGRVVAVAVREPTHGPTPYYGFASVLPFIRSTSRISS